MFTKDFVLRHDVAFTHETNLSSRENPDRLVKTSEDQYIRVASDSSRSSSEPEHPSPKSTSINATSVVHQPTTLKKEYNRVNRN